MARLKEAKIDSNVLDSALGAYILTMIAQHDEPVTHHCNKDPFTLRSMSKTYEHFSQIKVHSYDTRRTSNGAFDYIQVRYD